MILKLKIVTPVEQCETIQRYLEIILDLELETVTSVIPYTVQCEYFKIRWLDDVEDDIKALGKRRWRMKAQDRNEWTAIKREATVKLKGQ
jgi:hypothetical protein